jgi:hypothetical protein
LADEFSMENIFEQNLRKHSSSEVELEDKEGNKASGKYKIDLLDNLEDDEFDEP